METTNVTQEKSVYQLWKELGIVRAEFVFQCGGDNMGDTEIHLYNNKGEEVDCPEIEDYIDNEVYNAVQFYEASDGHYQGEAGVVHIEMEENEMEEDGYSFTYDKQSESEWSESFDETEFCKLTKEEFEFFKDYIHSVVGGNDGNDVNYKRDCILNDDQVGLRDDILNKIDVFACDFEIKNAEGEMSDWYNYSTNLEESDYTEEGYEFDTNNPSLLKEEDGEYFVAVYISKSYTIFRDENN